MAGLIARAVLVASGGGLLLSSCGVASVEVFPSEQEMERRIEDDVEQGTPLDEVMVYLSAEGEDQGIEAADHVTPAARFSQLEEAGLAPDTPVLAAILRGKGHGLQIFFIMDDGLEFREVIVKEYSDGFYIEF